MSNSFKSIDCPVYSSNEWDPLEEVIVGTAQGARVPPNDDPLSELGANSLGWAGRPFPEELIKRVQRQIDVFSAVLKSEGIVVRHPTPFDLSQPISTPFFSASCGYNFMNVRDLVLIVGDQIIETSTGSRSRYFETLALRTLFKEYFRAGARWISAPKPELSSAAFTSRKELEERNLTQEMTSEYEPLFDAADFIRCGSDIFCQRGARTNRFGIEWVKRHLGPGIRIHEIKTRCPFSVHIDTTFVPIAPGRALINPVWIGQLPDELKRWDLIPAPKPEGSTEFFQGVQRETSSFIAMNVFSIDSKRLFVDSQQSKLISILKDRGHEPMPLPFDLPPFLGGGFHCVTLDVRRAPSTSKP